MDYIHQILMILLVIDFTIYTALIDVEHINKGEYIINHFDRWLQRGCFFIAFVFTHVVYSIAAALLFTALFDQILNIARGKSLLYLGSISKWDQFFQNKIYLYIIVKVLALVVSIVLFMFNK